MRRKKDNKDLPATGEPTRRRSLRKQLLRAAVQLLATLGMATLYYALFSPIFDTPLEYEMKRESRLLESEYAVLEARYDSIERVLYNVIDRDKAIFQMLFESDPYNLDEAFGERHWEDREALFGKSNRELGSLFFRELNDFQRSVSEERERVVHLETQAKENLLELNRIPSIQPVVNRDLTRLTASYGMRIHPFYKTLSSHQGVDFTVAEGSRVFATADGRVEQVLTRNTSSGNTVVIDHGNGYQTRYSHLGKIYVSKGDAVKRGEIIAQSGNSGLSLAPHLHYEISRNGMRVDPIHYFFMELTNDEYQKIIRIAQSGMQALD